MSTATEIHHKQAMMDESPDPSPVSSPLSSSGSIASGSSGMSSNRRRAMPSQLGSDAISSGGWLSAVDRPIDPPRYPYHTMRHTILHYLFISFIE
jgi:hypothetical protein